MSAPGARRRARGYALQILYGMDLNDELEASAADHVEVAISRFWELHDRTEEQAVVEFTEALARDVATRIAACVAAWTAAPVAIPATVSAEIKEPFCSPYSFARYPRPLGDRSFDVISDTYERL